MLRRFEDFLEKLDADENRCCFFSIFFFFFLSFSSSAAIEAQNCKRDFRQTNRIWASKTGRIKEREGEKRKENKTKTKKKKSKQHF